jgi:hypothetical protein
VWEVEVRIPHGHAAFGEWVMDGVSTEMVSRRLGIALESISY